MNMQTIINFAAVALLAWFLYSRFAGVKGLRNLTADRLEQEMAGHRNRLLIDVREPGEVKQGYIPGAINIPLSQLKQRVKEIPADKQLYLYCRSGMRSRQAAKLLQKQGYRDLAHLQGGIMAWKGKLTK